MVFSHSLHTSRPTFIVTSFLLVSQDSLSSTKCYSPQGNQLRQEKSKRQENSTWLSLGITSSSEFRNVPNRKKSQEGLGVFRLLTCPLLSKSSTAGVSTRNNTLQKGILTHQNALKTCVASFCFNLVIINVFFTLRYHFHRMTSVVFCFSL